MRNIGSVEVTGSIPVSSFWMVEKKGFSGRTLFEMSLFFIHDNRFAGEACGERACGGQSRKMKDFTFTDKDFAEDTNIL